MEMELKSLIDKIKKDGVEQAEKEAREIITKSEDKARQLLSQARFPCLPGQPPEIAPERKVNASMSLWMCARKVQG